MCLSGMFAFLSRRQCSEGFTRPNNPKEYVNARACVLSTDMGLFSGHGSARHPTEASGLWRAASVGC